MNEIAATATATTPQGFTSTDLNTLVKHLNARAARLSELADQVGTPAHMRQDDEVARLAAHITTRLNANTLTGLVYNANALRTMMVATSISAHRSGLGSDRALVTRLGVALIAADAADAKRAEAAKRAKRAKG